MKNNDAIESLEQASEILGVPVKTHHNGYRHIIWLTPTHWMRLEIVGPEGARMLVLQGDPRSHGYCGRRGPRAIWVEHPTVRYLKRLAGLVSRDDTAQLSPKAERMDQVPHTPGPLELFQSAVNRANKQH